MWERPKDMAGSALQEMGVRGEGRQSLGRARGAA